MDKTSYSAKLQRKRDNSLGEYKENALLTNEIISNIEEQHSLKVKEIYKNIYLSYNGKIIEFDVLIEAETPSQIIRWISIELKESDVSKVIHQASARREFVDYSYIILQSSVKYIVEYLFYVCPEYIKKYKLGIFSNDVLILISKYNHPRIEIDLKSIKKNIE